MVADLGDAIQRTGAVVECEAQAEVQGDPHLLRVVIQNFVSNGIKFVAPGVVPRIRVQAEAVAAGVRLSVHDNGIGIAPEHHAQLFQLFRRLNNQSSTMARGWGWPRVDGSSTCMGAASGRVAARSGQLFLVLNCLQSRGPVNRVQRIVLIDDSEPDNVFHEMVLAAADFEGDLKSF